MNRYMKVLAANTKPVNGCGCGCGCGCGGGCGGNTKPVNGALDFLNTSFFDELFPKNAKGERSFVTKIEIDTPSIIKLAGVGLLLILVNKFK